jgi:hypothetical protein
MEKDDLLETMFGPGNSVDECSAAWNRNVARRVYFAFFSYVEKIRNVRDDIEADENFIVPTSAFNKAFLSLKQIKVTFASYFIKTSYNLYSDDAYPDYTQGQVMNYLHHPIIFATSKVTPRHCRNRFVRPVVIDGNKVITDYLQELNRSNLDYTNERARQTILPINSFHYVTELPAIEYIEARNLLGLDNNFSFFQHCLAYNLMNVMPAIFIRSWIKNLAAMSCEGRVFSQTNGKNNKNTRRCGNHILFDDYAIKHLYYSGSNGDKRLLTSWDNYGKNFCVNWMSKRLDITGANYFSEWYRHLVEKGKHNYLSIFRKVMYDVDLTAVGNLLMYSKNNGFDPPPVNMFVDIPMCMANSNMTAELDDKLDRCASRENWMTVVQEVVENGVLTESLFRAVMKCRIVWCHKMHFLIQNRYMIREASVLLTEMKSVYYDKHLNVNDLQI